MAWPGRRAQLAFVYRWGAEKERRFDRAGGRGRGPHPLARQEGYTGPSDGLARVAHLSFFRGAG